MQLKCVLWTLRYIYSYYRANKIDNQFQYNEANDYKNQKVMPCARINKLLNNKIIIISESCNTIDDELYKDLIFFCDLENLDYIYTDLINKSSSDLDKISNNIYNKFKKRFNTNNIQNLILEKGGDVDATDKGL